MTKPKMSSILNIGLVGSIMVSTFSFFMKMVPCKISTNNSMSFGLCKLPSIFQNISETSNLYYLISNNPLTGMIGQFILSFIMMITIMFFLKKKPEKMVDLTPKK